MEFRYYLNPVTGQPHIHDHDISVPPAAEEARAMNEQRFPAEWDEERVRQLLAELDARTEDEWVAADEAAAAGGEAQTAVTIPAALLPAVRHLLATHKSA